MKIIIKLFAAFIAIFLVGCMKEKLTPSIFNLNYSDSLIIENYETNVSYLISNTTNKSIEISVESGDTIVVPKIKSYIINPNQSVQIQFEINNKNLTNGVYFGKVFFLEGTKKVTINYRLNSYVEKKILLKANINDSKYSSKSGLAVFISSTNNIMYVLNVKDRTLDTIPISYSPNCLSISPDGTKAVVGINNAIAHVDLITRKVIRYIGVNVTAEHIVYAPNSMVYISSHQRDIVFLYVNTNKLNTYMYDQYSPIKQIKIHPSGKFLFGLAETYIDNIQANKIIKWNIEKNYLIYLANSQFGIDENYWLSDEGNLIMDNLTNIINTSVDTVLDLKYAKALKHDGFSGAVNVAISEQKNIIAPVFYRYDENNKYQSTLTLFDARTFLYIKTIEFEDFLLDYSGMNKKVKAIPISVFFDANENKLIVCTVPSESNIFNPYSGIELIDIN